MGNIVRIYEDVNHERDTIQDLQLGGSSGNGGGMEARVKNLESDVEYIKKDVADIKADIRDMRKQTHDDFEKVNTKIDSNFKWLLSVMGGFALLLLGAMAKGFGWL